MAEDEKPTANKLYDHLDAVLLCSQWQLRVLLLMAMTLEKGYEKRSQKHEKLFTTGIQFFNWISWSQWNQFASHAVDSACDHHLRKTRSI
jgi:hypothetical protein